MSSPISYKPQVNRAITKRWAEAKQISYEGNDWGDDDDDYYEPTPSSARGGQQPNWPAQTASAQRYGALSPSQGITQSNRSFTNPSPTRSGGRKSFDRGDDRRNFSSHAPSSSLEGLFPTAQHGPFPEPRHDFQQPHQEPSTRASHGQPPLHIQTQAGPQSRDRQPQARASSKDHAQHNRLPSTLDARGGPYQDPVGGGTYGPGDAGRRSESSGRPSLSELRGRSESPYRAINPPLSARSQPSRDESPAKRFPPRKSSLSQDTPILEPNLQSGSNSATGVVPASDSTSGPKPLPFIRPADIYKRMEEEREKERRSQESSRPSIDSNASRPRERDIFPSALQSRESSRPKIDSASGMVRDNRSPTRAAPSSSLSSEQLPSEDKSLERSEDTDNSRKLKSTLDPVAERKSEYGFENMLKEAGPVHPSSIVPATPTPAEGPTSLSASSTGAQQAEPVTATSASSKYSDRPDPVAASSQNFEKSLPHFLPVVRGVSDFGTDFLDRNSAPNNNLSPLWLPASEAQDVQTNTTALSGGPSSFMEGSQDAISTKAATSDPVGTEMRHSPFTGLRSVIRQGFDDSQDQVPQTPLSMADSVLRSNSASASEISPIISRVASSIPPSTGVNQSKSQHPPIAEEMTEARTPPMQSAAAQPRTFQEAEQSISEPALPPPPPPPPVKDGYRRDYSMPSPGNSQARSPVTVKTVDIQEGQLTLKSGATPTDGRRPWETTRNASGDSQEQRKAFETKAGLKDSPLSTPASTSGTLAGPSTRSTVRELAEKLESQSGRASPAISIDRDIEPPRPVPARLESFRPSLPGGWQSYTTNADAPSLHQERSSALRSTEEIGRPTSTQPDRAEDSPVSSEDDDMPTAGLPRPRREESDYGPSKTAFAAAAVAGSALVGAFTSATGLGSGHSEHPRSYEVSDDESVTTNPVARDGASKTDIDNVTSEDQVGPLTPRREKGPSTTLSIAPSPPAKDTPIEPIDIESPGSTLGYFPRPLRTSKTPETLQLKVHDVPSPTHPQMLPALSPDTSTQDMESDRLRKEIVRSLTPRSTPYEDELARPSEDDDAPLPQLPVADQPHSSGSTFDTSALPETDDAATRNINADSNHSFSDARQMPASPIVTDKALPQPITSAEVWRQPNTTRAETAAVPEGRLKLEHRFSWEPQLEIGASAGGSAASVPAVPPWGVQGSHGESDSSHTVRPYGQSHTPPRTDLPSVVPPMAPADTLRRVQDEAPNNCDEAIHNADAPPQGASTESSFKPPQSSLPNSDSNSGLHSSGREVPFRDILSLGTPQDRIQAFNTNREVIANQDTGLQEWLRAMGSHLSEHSDILRNNGRLSAQESENLISFKPSPARSKFQRLASLANPSQSTSQSTDPEYDPSITNSPSGGRSNNLHMPGQGKKLLKDAGKIGGQAGVVAKGLFTKGKNKLRAGGGGSDKGPITSRRKPSQPMIVINEPQHSSVTTNTAPQIPNLNISPIENGDQWYNPIDAVNSPAHERSIPPMNVVPRQESNNQDLMLPGHVDRPDQQVRQTSPRVSALGSFHDGDLPSRSISEVTRPTNSGDERSPIATIAENFSPPTVSEHVPPGASGQPLLVTTVPTLGAGTIPTGVPSAPVFDALGLLPDLSTTANPVTNPVATEPNAAERDILPVQDLTLKAQGRERAGLAQPSDASAAPQSDARSALLSQGSHLPLERFETALPASNLSPSRKDTPRASILDSGGSTEISQPPFDTGTPPYTEPKLSKEAEAAMYRSQVGQSENLADGLPAYPSTGEGLSTTPKPRIAPGDSVIPVVDLSHRRQVSSGPAQPRPFSFVSGGTILSSAGQNPVERLSTPLDAPSTRPDLAKEISVVGSEGSRGSLDLAKRNSKSSSHPFATDPDVKDHPAYRHSQDTARNKDISIPSHENQNIHSVVNRPAKTVNDDEPYRIPGPYVQEYRSPKQAPQGIAAQQFPPAQARPRGQPSQQTPPGVDPLRSHAPRSQNQMAPPSQSVKSSEDHAIGAVASPINDRPRQHSKGRLFRTRSKSRSVRSRNDEPQNAESKNEKRGGFFKQRTKADGATVHSQLGSLRGESKEGFNRQISRGGVDHNAVRGEHADQVRNLESPRPHSSSQHDARKKRFSGLGSLFGRSGTGSTKTSTKPQSPQSVQRASTFSHNFLGQPNVPAQHIAGAPDSMYSQNQKRHQMLSQPDTSGLNAPIGGYYAPSNQQQPDRRKMPHDPDSFNRNRFSTEQQQASPLDEQHQNRSQRPYQPGPQSLGQQLPSPMSRPEEARPPLQINTNTNEFGVGHTPKHHFVTAPPGPAPQLPLPAQPPPKSPRQAPHYSTQPLTQGSSYDSQQGAQSPYRYGARQGTSPSGASHAIDLHKRSRSPRNGRTLPEDERIEEVDRNDPASQLGTFSKSAGKSPRSGGGDSSAQEAPWRIGLPGNGEEDEGKRNTLLEREQEREQERAQRGESTTTVMNENGNSPPAKPRNKTEEETENVDPRKSEEDWRKQEQAQFEPKPTVAEKVMGVQLSLKQTAGNAMPKSPVELPGSKAPGDQDSDEEIVMSSTAYPGQEWAPESWAYGGNWDD